MRRLGLAVILVLIAARAQACNVPVFRYALERWRPDAYRVTVFHRGPLSEADQTALDALFEKQDQALANLVVRKVDAGKLEDEQDQALLASLGETPLPALVVQYPPLLRMPAPLWSGPLQESATRVIESPTRKELVRRLADGQTAVWLLLESGDAEKDSAAAASIEQEIKRLEKDLKLPELGDSPEDALLAGPPLRVAFSLLRMQRSDAERPLMQMLLSSESDLPERNDPMVFPVFGRGRALFTLVGPGITAENIEEAATFLVGPCSCQVKELNPGFDLLLAANWDALLNQEQTPAEVPQAATDEAVLLPIPPGSSSTAIATASSNEPAVPEKSAAVAKSAAAAADQPQEPVPEMQNQEPNLLLWGAVLVAVLAIALLLMGKRGT
jgi:hypothetical protein